jgi:histidyl-tRNA synthetase
MGMERLALLMELKDEPAETEQADIFVAVLGGEAMAFAAPLVHELRKLGLRAAMDYANRSLKAQMKQAGRIKARYALIIGDQELEQQEGVLRDMASKQQVSFGLQATAEELGRQLQAALK